MRIETRALELAKRFYAKQGHAVQDVSRVRGHNGYDLVVARAGERFKVEVKGCSREWQIPDLFETEFDQNRRLTADILCVVYLLPRRRPKICLIPRDAIPQEFVTRKTGYRISSRFKKQSVLERYISPM